MSARTPSSDLVRSAFAHPAFELLYFRVLRDVTDRRLEPVQREAAARALAFLLREQLVTERVATDMLAALHQSLDVSKVVRTLLLGLAGVSAPEKIAEWTRIVADRALTESHLPSFVSALRVLVELAGYEGRVPTRWRLSLLRSLEIAGLAPRVLRFAKSYGRRFPDDSWWLRTVRVRSTIASLRRRVTVAEMDEARNS